MNLGTYMVPVTVTEDQKKYISQQHPDKNFEEALQTFITECIKNKATGFYNPANQANAMIR